MPVIILDDSLPVIDETKSRYGDPPVAKTLDELYPKATKEVQLERKSRWDPSSETQTIEDSTLVIRSTEKKLFYSKNNFLGAVVNAYNNHRGLRLSPDDLLHLFSVVVAKCINANSEKYRAVFVNHAGKKKLVVKMKSPPGVWPWTDFLDAMSAKIDENVKTSLGLESTFSSSTQVTQNVATLMKMCAFKSYFAYGWMMCCGIRKVELTGTLEDWLSLREKVARCAEIFTSRGDMVNWSKHYLTILDRLIETYQSSSDGSVKGSQASLPNHLKTFWSRIVTYVPYGSGGQKYISGWARVLVPGDGYNGYPETLNLLNPASSPPDQSGDYYGWQDKMKAWAQICSDADETLSYVEIEANDHGHVYDCYATTGFVGWEKDGDFSSPTLGYVLHAVPKGRPDVAAEAEKEVLHLSTYTAAVAAARDSMDVERAKAVQREFVKVVQEGAKGSGNVLPK